MGTQRRFPPKCTEITSLAIQSTFRSLEMLSTRRYKIRTCSVVLMQLHYSGIYKGLSIILPKILGALLSFMKVGIFLIPFSIAFSNPKILGFLFLRKIS